MFVQFIVIECRSPIDRHLVQIFLGVEEIAVVVNVEIVETAGHFPDSLGVSGDALAGLHDPEVDAIGIDPSNSPTRTTAEEDGARDAPGGTPECCEPLRFVNHIHARTVAVYLCQHSLPLSR